MMIPSKKRHAAFATLALHTADAFTMYRYTPNLQPLHHAAWPSSLPTSTSSKTCLECICINCSRVTDCKAYHFVESKHSQPHMSTDPTFSPQDGSPTIHVNIRSTRKNQSDANDNDNNNDDDDDEMVRLWSEHVEQTKIAEEKNLVGDNGKLMGENTYDLSVKTTYEYDVVTCEDYIEDAGCWVRNMPEEIRLANPDFVPT